jgi:hypothetical protein
MDCPSDTPEDYTLNTRHIMKNGKPLFFGAVQIRKNYVSYHLMPIYVYSELVKEISPGLRKRMQGKSCFNFRKTDIALFEELAALTERGYEKYREGHYV